VAVTKTCLVQVATSNPGKLREFREMADRAPIQLDTLPEFSKLPLFEETAPTFAENAAGKAIHFSKFTDAIVMADDSGLVVPALGGEPGVHSARYAGADATDADRVAKLLRAMEGKAGDERRAQFVCVIALAAKGRAVAVVSASAAGKLAIKPRGDCGFGYDPVFLDDDLGLTFGEISQYEKNRLSHRGRAFRKALEILCAPYTAPGIQSAG
jgi:XTP/dITP diphosphohydrolase